MLLTYFHLESVFVLLVITTLVQPAWLAASIAQFAQIIRIAFNVLMVTFAALVHANVTLVIMIAEPPVMFVVLTVHRALEHQRVPHAHLDIFSQVDIVTVKRVILITERLVSHVGIIAAHVLVYFQIAHLVLMDIFLSTDLAVVRKDITIKVPLVRFVALIVFPARVFHHVNFAWKLLN